MLQVLISNTLYYIFDKNFFFSSINIEHFILSHIVHASAIAYVTYIDSLKLITNVFMVQTTKQIYKQSYH